MALILLNKTNVVRLSGLFNRLLSRPTITYCIVHRSFYDCSLDCKVFISAYHRLQSWERWLSQTTNDMTAYKEAIVSHLRILANATTQEAFDKGLQNLESSEVWNDAFGKMFRCWFENTWLNVKQVRLVEYR